MDPADQHSSCGVLAVDVNIQDAEYDASSPQTPSSFPLHPLLHSLSNGFSSVHLPCSIRSARARASETLKIQEESRNSSLEQGLELTSLHTFG